MNRQAHFARARRSVRSSSISRYDPDSSRAAAAAFCWGCPKCNAVRQVLDGLGHVEGFHEPLVQQFFRAGGLVTLLPVVQQVEIIGQHPQAVGDVCPLLVRQATLGRRQGDGIGGRLIRVKPGTCRGEAPPSCWRKTVLSLAVPTGDCIASQTRSHLASQRLAGGSGRTAWR